MYTERLPLKRIVQLKIPTNQFLTISRCLCDTVYDLYNLNIPGIINNNKKKKLNKKIHTAIENAFPAFIVCRLQWFNYYSFSSIAKFSCMSCK